MNRIWLEEYPQNVPPEIDVNEYSSIKDIVEQSCAKFASRPAYRNLGATLSFEDLERQSGEFAAYLQKVAGLGKGERVALMMPNILQYPVALFGVLRAGLTVVNVNPLYTARELEHQLSDSGAKAIVVMENFASTVEKVRERTALETIITTQLGELLPFPKSLLVNFVIKHVKKLVPKWSLPGSISFRHALTLGRRRRLDSVDISHQDIAFLQYTGGTTGVAKGAMLTHGNLVANLQQSAAWLGSDPSKQEVIIAALPLYHIFSLTANCLFAMKIGGQNVLITNPRDMPAFVKELTRVPFTILTGVNTLFNGLLNTPGFDKVDFSQLRLSLGGGTAVQRSVAERWKAVTGLPIIEAYGLTETSPAACINPVDNTDYNGSIGLPISSTEVSIRDDDGKPLGIGEVGEICISGPQVMAGYWHRPDETAKVMLDDNWLRTGDMGRMDERGYIFIEDRKKDMILVSGFNVYPNEIENVVAAYDGVVEVAAIGVPDEKSGEAVKLFLVPKDSSITKDEIRAHCRENLAGYKVPKQIEFRDELPKTNVGKILRRALRDEA